MSYFRKTPVYFGGAGIIAVVGVLWFLAIALLLPVLDFWPVFILCVIIGNVGAYLLVSLKKSLAQTAYDVIKNDRRPPVVFLRSFKDDEQFASNTSRGIYFDDRRTFEENLVHELKRYGPVVAIGDPSDTTPPLGAARSYVADSDWKETAEELIRSSQFLIIMLGDTGGIEWELSTVLALRAWSRTIIVFPPVNEEELQLRWNALRSLLLTEHLIKLQDDLQATAAFGECRIEGSIAIHSHSKIRRTGKHTKYRWKYYRELLRALLPEATEMSSDHDLADALSSQGDDSKPLLQAVKPDEASERHRRLRATERRHEDREIAVGIARLSPWKKILGLLALFSCLCGATAIADPTFFNAHNMETLVVRASLFGIIGIGVSIVLNIGGVDLSVGSVIGFVGSVMPFLVIQKQVSLFAVLSFVILACALIGLLHGKLITSLHTRPFVITICGMLIYRGLARWITDDSPQHFNHQFAVLTSFATGNVPLAGRLGVPVPFVILLALGALVALFQNRCSLRRRELAQGNGDLEFGFIDISRQRLLVIAYVICSVMVGVGGMRDLPAPLVTMTGIAILAVVLLCRIKNGSHRVARVDRKDEPYVDMRTKQRTVVLAYVLCALITGLGGTLFAAHTLAFRPADFGTSYELYALAVAILGGCALRCGQTSIIGILIGALMLEVIRTLTYSMGVQLEVDSTIPAIVILSGVTLDELIRRQRFHHAVRRRVESTEEPTILSEGSENGDANKATQALPKHVLASHVSWFLTVIPLLVYTYLDPRNSDAFVRVTFGVVAGLLAVPGLALAFWGILCTRDLKEPIRSLFPGVLGLLLNAVVVCGSVTLVLHVKSPEVETGPAPQPERLGVPELPIELRRPVQLRRDPVANGITSNVNVWPPEGDDWYIDRIAGFAVRFPDGWKIVPNVFESIEIDAETAAATGLSKDAIEEFFNEAASVAAVTPQASLDEEVRQRMVIVARPLPPGINMKRYLLNERATLRKHSPEFGEYGTGRKLINGSEWEWIEYRQVMSDVEERVTQYMTVRASFSYIVVCRTRTKRDDDFNDAFEKAVQTIRLR